MRKRGFSKALFKLEEFVNTGFAFKCGWRTRLKTELIVKRWRHESYDLPAQVFLKYKSAIPEFSNFSCIECIENIWGVFTVKTLFSISLLYVGLGFSAYVFSYHISHKSHTGCLLFNKSTAIETSKDLWKKLDSNKTGSLIQSRIGKILFTSPIVINVPTRASLAVATKDLLFLWLASLNNKSNVCKQISSLYLSWGPSFRFMVVYGSWIKPMSF